MIQKTRIGLVGCGSISTIYLENLAKFENTEVIAVADLDRARAESQAEAFHIPRVLGTEELLRDGEIEAVLNLTIPAAHAEVGLAALRNGKSVYNEKPLAADRKAAAEMLALAEAKGLRIGCAPDTFLGESLQNARRLLDEGAIGRPVAAAAFLLAGGPESWHPNPFFFYKPGGGPMFDMGPYYLTALTALLGPVKRVTGSARISSPQRSILSEPHRGKFIDVEIPSHIAGLLDFASGPVGTIVTSFDVPGRHRLPNIEIYGTEGTMSVPDPNEFTGTVSISKAGRKDWEDMASPFGYGRNSRGLGIADMAMAARSGRPHRANGATAYHVLDIMHAIHEASLQGKHIDMESTMSRPEPMPPHLNFGQVPA